MARQSKASICWEESFLVGHFVKLSGPLNLMLSSLQNYLRVISAYLQRSSREVAPEKLPTVEFGCRTDRIQLSQQLRLGCDDLVPN